MKQSAYEGELLRLEMAIAHAHIALDTAKPWNDILPTTQNAQSILEAAGLVVLSIGRIEVLARARRAAKRKPAKARKAVRR